MKRLESYLAFFGSSDLPLDFDTRSALKDCGETKSFTSWHKACDFIGQAFDLGEVAEGMDGFIVDSKTNRVVIRFSVRVNSQTADDSSADAAAERIAGSDAWRSTACRVMADGCEIVELSNVRDFAWELLEGAKRDVPFRLSFLERNAEQKAWCKALLMEVQKYRDMFGRTQF